MKSRITVNNNALWEIPLFLFVLVAMFLTGYVILLFWALVMCWFIAQDIGFGGVPVEPKDSQDESEGDET